MDTHTELKSACTHPDRELLGWDHDLAFGRCRACGQVLLKQEDTVWAIRPFGTAIDATRGAANDDGCVEAADDDL